MKRLLWLPTLAFCVALAACSGGGGSSITVPPPQGGFTLASLKGTYAFSMSGMDPSTGAYFARIGSFVADGAGNISSWQEDVVDLGTSVGQDTLSGKYNVLASGRGTIVLTDTTGNKLDCTLDLQSSGQGLLVETDGNFASSGSFNIQNTADFLATSVSGTYVFDFPGVSLSGTSVTPISLIGTITPNGSGVISGGVFDTNDANNGHIGPSTFSPGSFQLDPTYGSTYGRGVASFGGATFAFYIVDSTHIKFIEEDPNELVGSSGDALLQSGTIPTTTAAFTGSFAYLTGGSSTLTQGAEASVGRFTVSGPGTIGTISYDENNNGTATHISQGSNITNATYAIDTTNAGSGRGTMTFTDSTGGTFSYVFYLYSPTSGVIQDVSTNIIADGTLLGQSGSPFTLSGLAASYAYNWNGVNNSSGNEEDFIGLFTLGTGTTSNITGVLDGTVVGSSGGNSYPNIGTQGTLTIASDGTTNNTLQIVAGSPLSATNNSVVYVVNANTMFILDTDNSSVLAGVATRQSN